MASKRTKVFRIEGCKNRTTLAIIEVEQGGNGYAKNEVYAERQCLYVKSKLKLERGAVEASSQNKVWI